MASIPASSAISGFAATETAASRLPARTLNQDDFLKLLIAQLTTQDPLSPRKDTDFIAQMAQFSALEQSKSMQSDLARLRADQELLKANALIGRTVDIQSDDGAAARGVVSAVEVQTGVPAVIVNGQAYSLNQLLSISPTLNPS
ncbi:MAG: flagellar hook assembly protein FlgD [Chloroflexi bacterium]|nr:flagellar hook assembly protein FlgD [Chloroflexota bacterium]